MRKMRASLAVTIGLITGVWTATPAHANTQVTSSNSFEQSMQQLSTSLPQSGTLLQQSVNAANSTSTYPVTTTTQTVQMSDGVGLATTVFKPQSSNPPKNGWPAVIMIHGWGGNQSDYSTIAPVFAAHGFVVLTYDCRGFGQSQGQTGLAGPRDILDIYQLMTWLIQHQGVNSQAIGLTGISYGGGQSILAAADDKSSAFYNPQLFGDINGGMPPKVAAIAPIAGWTSLLYALYPNQVMKYSFDVGLYATGYNPQTNNYPPELTEWLAEAMTGVNTQAFVAALQDRSVQSLAQWQALATTPAYFFQAWKDELFPAEQVVPFFEQAAEDANSGIYTKTAAANDRLYLGGYGHAGATFGANEGAYIFGQVLSFMEQQLEGESATRAGLSADPVTIAPETWSGTGALQYSSTYPVSGAATTTDYLNGSSLSSSPAVAGTTPTPLVNSPTEGNFADVNVTTPDNLDSLEQSIEADAPPASAAHFALPLQASLNLMGQVRLKVNVQASLPTAELTARVYDYSPQSGIWTLVTRGAKMAGNLSATTPHTVSLSLDSAHHVFPAGDELVVDISPSDFPSFLYDDEPYTLFVDTGADAPSTVTLPVVG